MDPENYSSDSAYHPLGSTIQVANTINQRFEQYKEKANPDDDTPQNVMLKSIAEVNLERVDTADQLARCAQIDDNQWVDDMYYFFLKTKL